MQNVLNLLEDNNFDYIVVDDKIYSTTEISLLEDSFSFEIQIVNDDELYVKKTLHLKHDDNLYFGHALCHSQSEIISVDNLIDFLNTEVNKEEIYVDEFNFHLTYR